MVGSVRHLLSFRLAVLSNLNDRSGHAHLKETFGLTLSEWRVLGNIAHFKGASFSDIANVMLIDKGQLSRTVASLVSRRLVVSTAALDDRRAVTLSLSPEGESFHARVLDFVVRRNEALVSCLNDREQRDLDEILDKLAAFIEVEHAALSRGNARDAEAAARRATAAKEKA